MKKQNFLQRQQNLFSLDVEKLHWENLALAEQNQIVELLSQLLWSLSSHLVTQGGQTDGPENNG